MAPQAVLFDLDDTLVDWWGSIRRTLDDLVDDETAERLLAWASEHTWRRRDGVVVHRNTWKLHEQAADTWAAALPELDAAERATLVARFTADLWVGFFPEVVPTLDRLAEDHRLGLLSNNPYVPTEAARLRLHDWFEVLISVPPDEHKPHPSAFARGFGALGTAPERTVYVGDSIAADVEGALGAGMIAVWVDRWDDQWDLPADAHRVTSLAELPDLLDSL